MVKIIEGSVLVLEPSSVQDIPSPEEFYNQYIKFRKPVVIKNYISLTSDDVSWNKVRQEWQLGIHSSNQEDMVREMKERELEMLNYWKDRFNNLDVFVSELRENGLSHPPNYEKKMKFDQVIDILKIQEETGKCVDSHWLYLQQVPTKDLTGLVDDFKIPNLFSASPYSILGANSFFLGTTRTRTTLHYDRPLVDNLFIQVYGEKLWKLYEPQEGVNFYPFGMESKYAHVSKIQELDQVEDFPLFKKAKLMCEFILQPGDLIYLPKGYWHHVEHLSLSNSLNFWYY